MDVRKMFIAMVAIVLVFGIAGCQSAADKASEEIAEEIIGQSTGTDIEVDGDNVTIETDEGNVTMSSSEDQLPDGFPADFPVYSDAEIEGTSTLSDGDVTSYYVNLVSSDTALAIYEWYQDELDSNGWDIAADVKVGDESMLFSGSKDTAEFSLAIDSTDEGTGIAIILAVK